MKAPPDLVDAFLIGVLLYCFIGAVISTGEWFWLAIVLAPVLIAIKERML